MIQTLCKRSALCVLAPTLEMQNGVRAAAGRSHQLGEMVSDEACVEVGCLEVGVAEDILKECGVGGHAGDLEFAQSAVCALDRISKLREHQILHGRLILVAHLGGS